MWRWITGRLAQVRRNPGAEPTTSFGFFFPFLSVVLRAIFPIPWILRAGVCRCLSTLAWLLAVQKRHHGCLFCEEEYTFSI